MPFGPGRHGENAKALLDKYGGRLCIVIIVGEPASFDVATDDPELLIKVPHLLRAMADDVEKDVGADVDYWRKA